MNRYCLLLGLVFLTQAQQLWALYNGLSYDISLSINRLTCPDFRLLACEQALRGALAVGREKEGQLVTTSREFEYLHRKVDAKCWSAEMTLVMTSSPLARAFQSLFHSRSFPLRADWRKSGSSVDGEPQMNLRWNSNSRDVVACSPSFSRPAARAPRRACSQAIRPSVPSKAWRDSGRASFSQSYARRQMLAGWPRHYQKQNPASSRWWTWKQRP